MYSPQEAQYYHPARRPVRSTYIDLEEAHYGDVIFGIPRWDWNGKLELKFGSNWAGWIGMHEI